MTEAPTNRRRLSLRALCDAAITVGVVGCIVVAFATAVVKLDDVLGLYDERADTNAALTYDQRAHTSPGWGPTSGKVLEDARLWMPEDARYRVVFGPGFDRVRSPDFSGDLLLSFLLPRRPTASPSAEWIICYGCDASTLGERFEVLSRAAGGPTFGRVLP